MKTARSPKTIEQIREKILEAALDIIAGHGYEALTMRRLASKTGMTAPNLYNYFANKDDIYISLVIQGFEMLYAALDQARHGAPDPARRVRAMIEAYLDFGFSHPRYYDIMFTLDTPKYHDYVGTPLESRSAIEYRISMDIADLALKAAADLLGASADNEAIRQHMIHLWSLLHGMITLHNSRVIGYVADSPRTIYQAIIDEFMAGLTDR